MKAVYENSVDLQIWSHELLNVAKQDISLVTELVNVCAAIEPEYLSVLMETNNSLESFITGLLKLKGCDSFRETKNGFKMRLQGVEG